MTFKWRRPDGSDCWLYYRDKPEGGGQVAYMKMVIVGYAPWGSMSEFFEIGSSTLSNWRKGAFAIGEPEISGIDWQFVGIEGGGSGPPMALYKVAPRAA